MTAKKATKKTAAKKTVNKPTAGDHVKMMQAAINEFVIPVLRDEGFEGGYPNLRRITDKQTHVMWFSLDRGMNGRVQVGVANVARRTDTSVKDDYQRAIDIRNRRRKVLTELVPPVDAALFWYEDAAARWGADWPSELATLLLRLLQEHAGRYFGTC